MPRKISINLSFLPLLALLFIGLKLTKVIAWSWWWVLAPLWGPIVLSFALIASALGIFGIIFLIGLILRKRS